MMVVMVVIVMRRRLLGCVFVFHHHDGEGPAEKTIRQKLEEMTSSKWEGYGKKKHECVSPLVRTEYSLANIRKHTMVNGFSIR